MIFIYTFIFYQSRAHQGLSPDARLGAPLHGAGFGRKATGSGIIHHDGGTGATRAACRYTSDMAQLIRAPRPGRRRPAPGRRVARRAAGAVGDAVHPRRHYPLPPSIPTRAQSLEQAFSQLMNRAGGQNRGGTDPRWYSFSSTIHFEFSPTSPKNTLQGESAKGSRQLPAHLRGIFVARWKLLMAAEGGRGLTVQQKRRRTKATQSWCNGTRRAFTEVHTYHTSPHSSLQTLEILDKEKMFAARKKHTVCKLNTVCSPIYYCLQLFFLQLYCLQLTLEQ